MKKPHSLRAALTNALPELKANPDNLVMYINNGKMISRLTNGANFELQYQVEIVIENFKSSPEAIGLPIILWLQENQKDAILNHDKGNNAISFEVEILDSETVDISIKLDLTEIVQAEKRPDGSYLVKNPPDPKINDEIAEFLGKTPTFKEVSGIEG